MLATRRELEDLVNSLSSVLDKNYYFRESSDPNSSAKGVIGNMNVADLLVLYELYNRDIERLVRELFLGVNVAFDEREDDDERDSLSLIRIYEDSTPAAIDNLHLLSNVRTVFAPEPVNIDNRDYLLSKLRTMPALTTVYFYNPEDPYTPDAQTFNNMRYQWTETVHDYDDSGIRYISVGLSEEGRDFYNRWGD